MTSTSVTLFKKLFEAVEHFEHQFPSHSFSFVDTLIDCFNINQNTDWINWIINTNNDLFRCFINDDSLIWLEPFHNLLAQLLIEYDTSVNTHHTLMPTSIFMRDCHLFRQYGFHPLPLIRKHISSTENMPMYKTCYYMHDPVFNDTFSNPKTAQGGSPLQPPLLAEHSAYMKDPYFQSIVAYHGTVQANNAKFAGISIAKGGIFNVLHIIIDQEAHVRFFGGLTPSLNTESAYTHGPIFMVSSQLHQTLNTEVFKIKMPDLIFLIPTPEMRDLLRLLLYRASTYRLIPEAEIDSLLENQIITYKEYCERHCQIQNVETRTTLEMTPHDSDSARTISELLEESPLLCSVQPSASGRHLFFPSINDKIENKLVTEHRNIAEPLF